MYWNMYAKFNKFKLGGDLPAWMIQVTKIKNFLPNTVVKLFSLHTMYAYIVRNFQKVCELLIACISYKEEMDV